jgi:hypothetical protein
MKAVWKHKMLWIAEESSHAMIMVARPTSPENEAFLSPHNNTIWHSVTELRVICAVVDRVAIADSPAILSHPDSSETVMKLKKKIGYWNGWSRKAEIANMEFSETQGSTA